MHACVFCDILAGRIPASRVYQDELCTAFMDIQPITPGHVLIVPNRHVVFLSELEEKTGAQMFRVAQRLAQALRQSGVRCEGINFFLADGEAAGQEIFHIHLHVFPRYRGDGFGFQFSQAYFRKPVRPELDALAEQVRKALNQIK